MVRLLNIAGIKNEGVAGCAKHEAGIFAQATGAADLAAVWP